ncbi:MAG: DUF3048 domain-containing protein [Chloroflexi bacterium]|nr:DUF3048 domain-containing protein [Chloroflexota bacterium]
MDFMEHRRWLRIVALIAAAMALATVVLAGCGAETAVPATPTPTRTSSPTSTPAPTATPAPPTETPMPTPTPSPTVIPTDINPLTGEKMEDSSVLEQVPVAIKISNWPGQYVRPQSGINSADLIFEHYNEGWFASRWTAIYLGKNPERVGPVRSGRLIDLELPAIYKAVFACSGFSNGVLALVKDSDLYPDRVASPSVGVGQPVFYRDYSRNVPLEHTMYSSPALVREWAAERGVTGRQELDGMLFSSEVPTDGVPATTIQLAWRSLDVEWRFDEESGRYLRWSDGRPHTDALDGEQLNVANIVFLYVPQWNTNIIEEPHSGALSIQFALWDSNRATIFRDGVMVEAFWQRWQREDMLTLTDEKGNVIPLNVGNTFFEVIPTEAHEVEITIES